MSTTDTDLVCVVGLGYVGLPTAVAIATAGVQVYGVDTNPVVVDGVNRGEATIVEPGLPELLAAAAQAGRLCAGQAPVPAAVYVIAVPTPIDDHKQPDIGYVITACRSIAPHLRQDSLVILESTSPVGTTEAILDVFAEMRPDLRFPSADDGANTVSIAYCPERVIPGSVMLELAENERIVGGISQRCTERAQAFYEIFVQATCWATRSRVAELAKLTENAYRDVNIAFANEISAVCDELDVDVWQLQQLVNRHPRVDMLRPGPGVGGHCIAVDPWFIASAAPEQSALITTSRTINDARPGLVARRVASQISDPSATIVCLGLAYKPNVDDFRTSPAIEFVRELAALVPSQLSVVEPYLDTLPDELGSLGVQLLDLDQAVARADVVVGLVAHDEFRDMQSSLGTKMVFDEAGLWT